MRRASTATALAALWILVGCEALPPSNDGKQEDNSAWIKLQYDTSGDVVYVSSQGGARVDCTRFLGGKVRESRRYTVLTPCDGLEVLRLAKVLPGVAKGDSIRPAPRQSPPRHVWYCVDGNEGRFSVGLGMPRSNFIVEAVFKELLEIANEDLVDAVVSQRYAEHLAETGDQKAVCDVYRSAFDDLGQWMVGRNARVRMEGIVEFAEFFSGEISHALSSQMGEDASLGALSAEGWRKAWLVVAEKRFAVRWNGDVAVVTFSPTAMETRDLPSEIPQELVEALMKPGHREVVHVRRERVRDASW